MKKDYFLHAISQQLNSVKSLLKYLLPETSESDRLLLKYEGLAEEIAEAVAEINEIDERGCKHG